MRPRSVETTFNQMSLINRLPKKEEVINTTVTFVEQWPLTTPSAVCFVLITYLYFVLKLGPMVMKDKPPVQMKTFLVIYNGIKVINSGFLALQFVSYINDKGLFPKKCVHDHDTLQLITTLYYKYMITKLLDLFDTIFSVIRKKQSQVTFLHVYHHSFMLFITWFTLKFDPSDHWGFMAGTNCLIHTVMYFYYGVAVLGPKYRRFIWWKKYLTIAQLVQFVLVLIHICIQASTSMCPVHSSLYWVGLVNVLLFMILFYDFFKKSYSAKQCGNGRQPVEFACTSRGL